MKVGTDNMNNQTTENHSLTGKESSNALIQLHIAEYQALTTRGSYWIILQASLIPIVPIYLALAVEVWKSGTIVREVVIWIAVAGLQLIGIVWGQTLVEGYNVVRYIECYLRPLIDKEVGT